MHSLVRGVFLLTACVFVAACANATPPSRMGQYLKSDQQASAPESLLKTEQRPLKAGLVLVLDQPDQTAAAVLPLSLIHISEPTRPY